MEPPAFPSEPIFGQPATNRAPSTSDTEEQLNQHLRRAQQRKEEKYRQGIAAAHDTTSQMAPVGAAGAPLDYQLQGAQFAQQVPPPVALTAMRTRMCTCVSTQYCFAINCRQDISV